MDTIHIPKACDKMPTFIKNTIFFIGWLLSPLTFWNDAFVNIPISYLCASLLIRFIKVDFIGLMLVVYWVSNIVGLCMMYLSGRAIFEDRGGVFKALMTLVATIAVYSVMLIALGRIGIIKPI